MAPPREPSRNVLSNVLMDLRYMVQCTFVKCDEYLKKLEEPYITSVETAEKVRNLLNNIKYNVTEFMETVDAVCDNQTPAQKIQNSKFTTPKKKINLSLRRNGDTQDTDVDVTSSESEEYNRTVKRLPEIGEPSGISAKDVVTNGNADATDFLSDSDSQKSIPAANFEACSSLVDDPPDCEVTHKIEKSSNESTGDANGPGEIKEEEEEKHEELKDASKNTSFDFDDSHEDSGGQPEKGEDAKSAPSETSDQQQKDNYELLELLNKVTDDVDDATTERDADEALQLLEDEISLASFTDSDETTHSLWQLSDNDLDESTESEESGSESSNESEGNVSDIEDNDDEEQEDQLESCRDFKINLNRRVDEMDESEIDRLCDLHNLNKRKCLKALGSGRKKRKRIRLLSTSSSSSSEEPSENSTTPDLIMDTEERPSTPNDIEPSDAVAVLADELADKLSDERVEISSDSEMDVDDRPKTKKKSEEIVRKEEEEIYEIKSDDEVQEEVQGKTLKKRASWRDDPLLGSLWTDSDDSDSGIPEVKKSDSGDDKDRKSPPKVSNETTVISDSSDTSSDSDDVTFVDEVTDGVKGRRNIRSILSDDELSEMSQLAKKEEKERVTRLKEHTKTIESIRSQNEDFVLDADVKTGEPLVTVRAELATMLKPHQKTGVQFMWQACYESVAILKEKPGTGCILAHCMGLGKTLQVVTLVYTLFAHPVTNTRHVLIICPLSTVINWKNEFKKALKQLTRRVDTPIYCLIKADLSGKIKVVINWRRTGGVLIMGYDTFQIITNEKTASKVSADEKKAALEALIDPGPDLVVCDEGHMLKNGKTLKTQAVMRVKTKRRIVLTGTPLQNNLKEYYFMVQFVKPHLLGTYQEYMNRFATPIMNGQYHDSRPEDIKLMKKRTHVLTNLLKKTINRVEAKTLSTYLPEITDYTIFIKLTPIQVALYTKFIDMVTSQNDLSAVFFHVTRVTNFNNLHPYTLQLYYNKPKPKKKKKTWGEDELDQENNNESHIRDDWYKDLLPEDVATNVDYSAKLKVVMDIIREAANKNEKVLVFAQHLVELDLLEHFLTAQGTNWIPFVDYYRMDGETSVENREQLCTNFNNNPAAKLFLLTHRVGGLGLNLTGANRVVLIGSNHNPSHDTQSMYRVYRFGQAKKCYVYRLLSIGTMEEKIYRRCVVKLAMSGTVVDKYHFDRHYKSNDLQEMYKYNFDEFNERPIPVVPSDWLLVTLLRSSNDIYNYHLHNALLENRPEEELTDEDKKLAWEEFNNMEETAKNVAVSTSVVHAPPPLLLNLSYPFNRFGQYCGTRNNVQNMVPNPVNNNTKGFFPRAIVSQIRRPSANNQTARPQTSGLNRTTLMNNPFSLLVQNVPQTSGGNVNGSAPNGTNTTRASFDGYDRFRSPVPGSDRLQNFVKALQERRAQSSPTGAPQTSEFNYALNKVVR